MKKAIASYAVLAALIALVGGAVLAGCGGGEPAEDTNATAPKKDKAADKAGGDAQ